MADDVKGFLNKIFTKIGEIAANGIRDEIKELHKAIEEQSKRIDENEKDRIRYEILDFANSCHNGRNHTKDEFLHIMTLNDKYKILLERTHDINGVFDIEYKYISDLFAEKLKNNSFLANGGSNND